MEIHENTRLIFENMNDAVIVTDDADVVRYWNKAAVALYDIEPEDALGKPIGELFSIEDCKNTRKSIKDILQKQGYWRGEAIHKTRQGKSVPVDWSVNRFFGDEGKSNGIICFSRDNTARIQSLAAEKKEEREKSHRGKMEAIGQLAAGIAHEINTPIQYIGDNTRFLKNSFEDMLQVLHRYNTLMLDYRAGELNEDKIAELEEFIEEMDLEFIMDEIPPAIEQSLEGISRVSEIVLAMKEFSHPGEKEMAPIDINHAISSTITVSRNEWKYCASIETDFATDLPPVPCLAGEINQVFLNLILNATHSIQEKIGDAPKEKGTIFFMTRRDDDFITIRISDTGNGIPKHIQDKIFDPFFTTKGVGKGTGQGLAIARSVIVDKHQGKLDFSSDVGAGTVFVISLPLERDDSLENEDES